MPFSGQQEVENQRKYYYIDSSKPVYRYTLLKD